MAGALGVVITTDVTMSGQHAQPVYVDDTLPIVGPSRAVVVTTGEVPQLGGPAIPVRLAPTGTPAIGPALPVYVVPGGGSLGGGGVTITYLLLDQFTTNAAAPLASPRTCEPGPGTTTIVDTGNKLTIASNRLASASLTTSNTDPRVYSTSSFARVNGRTFAFLMRTDGFSGTVMRLGWASANTGVPGVAGIGLVGSVFVADNGFYFNLALATGLAINTDYTVYIVLRTTGSFVVVAGGNFGTGSLVWVSASGTTTPLFAGQCVGNGSASVQSDSWAIVDAAAPWNSDYGIATSRTASPANPTSGTMIADGLVEFTWTVVTGETLELDVRRTDASNRWCVRCSQAGSTIKLIEINAGVETERSSAAQTWTNATTYRIVVRCVTQDIRTYTDTGIAVVAKNSYTSASFNQTATGVNVAGGATGSNLIAWPYAVTVPSV